MGIRVMRALGIVLFGIFLFGIFVEGKASYEPPMDFNLTYDDNTNTFTIDTEDGPVYLVYVDTAGKVKAKKNYTKISKKVKATIEGSTKFYKKIISDDKDKYNLSFNISSDLDLEEFGCALKYKGLILNLCDETITYPNQSKFKSKFDKKDGGLFIKAGTAISAGGTVSVSGSPINYTEIETDIANAAVFECIGTECYCNANFQVNVSSKVVSNGFNLTVRDSVYLYGYYYINISWLFINDTDGADTDQIILYDGGVTNGVLNITGTPRADFRPDQGTTWDAGVTLTSPTYDRRIIYACNATSQIYVRDALLNYIDVGINPSELWYCETNIRRSAMSWTNYYMQKFFLGSDDTFVWNYITTAYKNGANSDQVYYISANSTAEIGFNISNIRFNTTGGQGAKDPWLFFIPYADNNYLYDSYIDDCDIGLRSTESHNFLFHIYNTTIVGTDSGQQKSLGNCSIESTVVEYNPDNDFSVFYWLQTNVTDKAGNTVADADVEVYVKTYNATNQSWALITDWIANGTYTSAAGGDLNESRALRTLKYIWWNESYWFTYKINVSKSGYNETSVIVNFTEYARETRINITIDVLDPPTLAANDTAPDSPTSSQNLTFNATCADEDVGDTLTVYVQLFNGTTAYGSVRNTTAVNSTNTQIYELDSSTIRINEIWTGEYWCGDGLANTTRQNDSVTILNSAPGLAARDTNPDIIYTTDNILFNITCADNDTSQTIIAYLKIYNNTVITEYPSPSDWTSQVVTSGENTLLSYSLPSENTNESEVWTGEYWCGDGTANSSKLNDSVTIANSAPTFNDTLTGYSVIHSDNLAVDINCSDANTGDTVTYYDNTSLFNIVAATGVISDNPTQGEIGNYYINISCGDRTVNTSASFWYNITNTPPTVASATISPSSPALNDNLTCNNGAVADANGDTVTLSYDWNNGTWQGINSSQLGTGNTSAGQIWKCKIVPNDDYENGSAKISGDVSIGTGLVAPVINNTNATTANTGVLSNDTYPTNNNSWVNISVGFYDTNANENYDFFVCSSDSANISGCLATAYCNVTDTTAKTASCRFNISNSTQSYTFYAFVIDNNSLESGSVAGSYKINFPPSIPSRITPTYVVNKNYAIVNFSSTDANSGDTINYSIFGGTVSGSLSLLYNGSNSYYNWTSLPEGIRYIRGYGTDNHNYDGLNSSEFSFFVDFTPPVINLYTAVPTEVYTTNSVTFSATLTDALSGINANACVFEMQKSDYNGGANFNLSATNSKAVDTVSITQTMATFGSGTLNWRESHCSDNMSNTRTENITGISITITTAPGVPGGPGGGGGGGGGADIVALKFGLANIMNIMSQAKIVLEDREYISRLTRIDIDANSFVLDIRGKETTFEKDILTPIDLDGDALPDVSITAIELTPDVVTFWLDYYGEVGAVTCEENVKISNGIIEECEFACGPLKGCYFKEVGEATEEPRECGTRLWRDGICVEESTINYIISEDFFVITAVLKKDLNQATGQRNGHGYPVKKTLDVTNLEEDTIFVTFEGSNIEEMLEKRIQSGATVKFTITITPERALVKGFINMVVKTVGDQITHSLMYETSVVPCLMDGEPSTTGDACCSGSIEQEVCAIGASKESNIAMAVITVLVFIAAVAFIIYMGSPKLKGKLKKFKFLPIK